MKRFISISFLIVSALGLVPSALLAATYSENLETCINGNLSQTESDAFLSALTRWKELYVEKIIRDTEDCYEKLTGKLAVFVQGEGLVVGSEAQLVLAERKRLAEEAEAKAEAVLLQPTIREDLKCSLLEEWDALSNDLAAANAIINADALSENERKSEAYLETYNACRDWYRSDRTKALTSSVCSPMFLEFGLPDSDIAGPTRDEVLAAQSASAGTYLEISLIDSRLRSVQFDEDYVANYSEERLYDFKKELEDEREAQAALSAPSDGEPLSSCEMLWLKWKSEN